MDVEELAREGWPAPTAAQMREAEEDAITRRAIPAALLMDHAGRAAALAIRTRFPGCRRPLVICGAGNNGGDGLVVAHVLQQWDRRVEPCVLLAQGKAGDSAETRWNLERVRESGIEILVDASPARLEERMRAADLIVDALFGVGLSRAVDGELSKLLARVNEAGAPRVAVDLPSGVFGDRADPQGAELRPDLIVTLALPKLALALRSFPASVLVAEIGIPRASIEVARIRQRVWTRAAAAARLPPRAAAAHKGSFGHVLVVAGSRGKTGAAALAAQGAVRAGAGLVTVAVPRELEPILEVKLTEAMTIGVDDAEGGFAGGAIASLLREAAARDVLVVGPGLSQRPGARELARALAARVSGPLVLDADGLNAFAGEPEALRGPGPRVLTPHPGEMARLLARSVDAVQRDRLECARELARRSGAVVLLKGARSVIATPEGDARINPTGGPGLATGGTGDVLAGVIGALLGQGLGAFDAASLGAYLHGMAGEERAVGLAAQEIAAGIPAAWGRLLESTKARPDDDALRPFP